MSKLYECIYAYIYKNNYAGNCSVGKQVYTLTEGLTQREVDMVTGLMPYMDNCGLAKVDKNYGVKPDSDAEPDYDMSSYAYYPVTRAKGYRAVCRFGLRKSLKGKNVRGTKEIVHAIICEGDFGEGYAADYAFNPALETFGDIRLDESQEAVGEAVCEVKPEMLKPLKAGNVQSYPLTATDIRSLGAPAIKALAEIINAIFLARKNRKTAYIVYDPENWKLAVDYIRAALKLLPARLANEISFITCYGRTESVNIDICGVPSRDDGYLSALKKRGYVVKIDLTGAAGTAGEKVPFAAFLSKASLRDVENWLDESANYYEYVTCLEDINEAMKLYLNRDADFEEGNTAAELKNTSDSIALITRNLDLISKIPYECRAQVKSVSLRVEKLCAEIQNIRAEMLYRALFVPLTELYTGCARRGAEETDMLADMIYMAIFGIPGQSGESARRHFELLSLYGGSILKSLSAAGLDIIERIQSDWGFLRGFFEDYFGDAEYVEYATTFACGLLKELLKDVESQGNAASDVRDYFVTAYLSVKSNQLAKILELAFSGSAPEAVYGYALNVLLRADCGEELFKDRIEVFCNYIIKNGLLESAAAYFRDMFVAPFGVDAQVVETIFGNLLKAYVLPPEEHTLEELYKGLKAVQSLISPHENIGLNKFVYDDYARRVINPLYVEALARVRFEDVSDEDMQRFGEFIEIYGTTDFSQCVDKKFCSALGQLLENYRTYKAQSQREEQLVLFRVDFVVRELILLDGKSVLKIMNAYIGQDKMAERFAAAGIGEKPQKHEKFLKVCADAAREFLTEKVGGLEVGERRWLSERKVAFVEDIQKIKRARSGGSPFRRLGDGVKGIIASSVFTAAMAAIVAVVCYLLFRYYDNGYFKSAYIVFFLAAIVISEVMYWYNFKDRRLRSVLMVAAWQTAVILVAMVGLYVLVQYVLIVAKI